MSGRDPLTLTFLDPVEERAFWAEFARDHRRSLQGGLALLTGLYAAFGVLDARVFPEVAPWALALRYGVVVPAMLAAWPWLFARSRREALERHVDRVVLYVALVAMGGMLSLGALVGWRATVHQVSVASLGLLVAVTFVYSSSLRFIHAAPLALFASVAGFVYAASRVALPDEALASLAAFGVAVNVSGLWISHTLERQRRDGFVERRALEAEHARSRALLTNALPASVVDRLERGMAETAEGRPAYAKGHPQVTVVLADLVGFTPLAERLPPEELAAMLDRIFTRFDAAAERLGVEKIKTLGDAWMGAAGAPEACEDHAERGARLALALLAAVRELGPDLPPGTAVRIGVHSGWAVGGVIGRSRFAYDLWGDAVRGAVQAEQGSEPGAIRLSPATAARLGEEFHMEAVPSAGEPRWWLRAAAPSGVAP